MSATQLEIRRGAYYDSVVLMQLQQALTSLPDVLDAGVVMGTGANKELLRQTDLLPEEAKAATGDDLIVVVKAKDENAARAAFSRIAELIAQRKSSPGQDYSPHSVETAVKILPDARWVIVSVPGRYAAGVAHEALDFGKNVFLYSDNVLLQDEIALKKRANALGLMVMGPDCGTAIVAGVGFGFANKVRRGPIGLIGASGTGLQAVTSAIHKLGGGITHALGTGGRDLSYDVGAITTLHGLDLLGQDAETSTIVLISKPPATEVAEKVLRAVKAIGKPTVVDFIGYSPHERQSGNVRFAATLDETARIAVELVRETPTRQTVEIPTNFAEGQRYFRGLFSGGTLAYEALLLLKDSFPIHSNISLNNVLHLANIQRSEGHTVVDLGEDEFTVGRLHPMMDNGLRIRRLRQEAADPEVAVILLDVVLGYGAHKDPAGELAPAIFQVREQAQKAGRNLEVVTLLIGTDEDPQDFALQAQRLREAGARVETCGETAHRYVESIIRALNRVDIILRQPVAAINVGLEFFTESLCAQNAPVIQVQWKPPAAGNEKLAGILQRMKGRH